MQDELQKHLYNYNLPPELIAQTPIPNREDSRLLVLHRASGKLTHTSFKNIRSYLRRGDCLVINDTKVIPARLLGRRASGGSVEVLLLRRLSNTNWEALVKPGRNMREGAQAFFGETKDTTLLSCTVKQELEDGKREVSFEFEGIFEEVLDALGEIPLPPYITQKLDDIQRYQTVYAANEGSVAAPTAGLHFTQELLQELEGSGIKIAKITLHVGLGTFRPVKEENLTAHTMHAEQCIISRHAADAVNACKAQGGRVIAVGTTSCRTLESMCADNTTLQHGSMWTSKYIYPGYQFKLMDGLVTNFHLPESTLIMLVSAFAGRENILNAYKEAISHQYRFFSFGDAMLLI